MAGWFVEVPRDLKKEFELLYPGRSAKKKLTIAMIRWAIRVRPDLDVITGKKPLPSDDNGEAL